MNTEPIKNKSKKESNATLPAKKEKFGIVSSSPPPKPLKPKLKPKK